MSEHNVVVVGAGLGGAQVVQTLREEGFSGDVTLVGAEPELPYDRPKLSKEYLQGKLGRDEICLHRRDWYEQQGVRLIIGERVDSIDRTGHTVLLASGETLPYGHLVLATGAESRHLHMPGEDLPGVRTLRELAESDALREEFARGGRLAVIGAGWIGLEVAAAARMAGMDVTVVAPVPQPLSNILGERIGAYFADLHRRNGVDVRMEVGVESVLELDGRANGIRTDHGDIEANLVLLAVGAAPRLDLARAAGLEVDNGVLVDEKLRTADPAILAIGDIANAQNTLLGQRLRREHWDNALRQGALAARTIMGRGGTYDWLPYFFTDQFDLGMEYVGNNSPDDETLVRGSMDSGEFIVFWHRDGMVTASMNVNVWDVNDTLREIVGHPVEAERLADTSVELTDLVPKA
ncbi:Reductase C-terminal [Raineyella antarctica]|uniref:Reductase C-terminal n=1 Tax=Raineyella antarctica TaxID=1577474 RepID=A0A1G6GLF4_9ACTN|nr:FAD-dependent oxidoreductase [Raineyella antarctica]SDB82838.1 Reductase C-terminal [Raineyella antarctica]